MIIAKIALFVAFGAAAVASTTRDETVPEQRPGAEATHPQAHSPTGDINSLAQAFQP